MKIKLLFKGIACLSLCLFASDAGGQAIQTIKDINTGSVPPRTTSSDEMLSVGNRLYISTADDIAGSELWSLKVTAKFNGPEAIFRENTAPNVGAFIIADKNNHSIRRISTSGNVSTLAGNAGRSGYLNSAGLAALFDSPSAAASDNLGNIYVADTTNHVIRKITKDGLVTLLAGANGQAGFANGQLNTSNGTSTARFRSPAGLFIFSTPSTNTLYVADTGNHTIRRITIGGATEGLVSTLAGGENQNASGSLDASGTSARFNSPKGLAATSTEVFVADTGNHTIRRITVAGAVVTTLAGTAGSSGALDGTGVGQTRFNSPQALALSTANLLFVADTGNHTIRQLSLSGAVTTIAGTAGSSGLVNGVGTSARFNSPRGISAEGTTKVFVADTLNQVIREVSVTGTAPGTVSTYAGAPEVSGADDGAADGLPAEIVPTVVKDIVQGQSGSSPENLAVVSNATSSTLYFTAQDFNGNHNLWKSNGLSSNTILVKTFEPSNQPQKLTNVNGLLYFEAANSLTSERVLWRSNGTPEGTVIAQAVTQGGDEITQLNNLTWASSNTLLFSGTKGATGISSLYRARTSGTATTVEALNLPPASFVGLPWDFQSFQRFGGNSPSSPRICFVATSIPDDEQPGQKAGRELFYIDPEETLSSPNDPLNFNVVENIQPADNVSSDPNSLTLSGDTQNGRLFFLATTDDNGEELWSTTSALDPDSTSLSKDINSNQQSSGILNLTPISVNRGTGFTNNVVFTADDLINGNELWISDGTDLGTEMLKNITEVNDGNSSDLSNFVSLSPHLVIFTRTIGTTNGPRIVLWRTDGTASGTVAIEDFETEPNRPQDEPDTAVNFRMPTVVGNTLYFMIGEDQLWKTNGSSDAGTVRVYRFRQGTAGSESKHFTALGGQKVVFSAFDKDNGQEPWITDSTEAGTMLLSDISTGTSSSNPANFTVASPNLFFFTASPELGRNDLYIADGNAANLLKRTNATGDSNVRELFWHASSSTLFFSASDNTSGAGNNELWKSVRTTANGAIDDAVKVKEINPGSLLSSNPAEFTAIGSTVYFAASDALSGRELYRTNGTENGTTRVRDINPSGTNSSDPKELVIGPGGKIYFVATGSTPPVTLGGLPVFAGRELWASDGTENGTKIVRDIAVGSINSIDASSPAYLTPVGGSLFFVANDGVKGKELWRTNGTSSGTTLVKDINTSALTGSDPKDLVNVNGKLFFTADDGINGRELWTITSGAAVMVNFGSRKGLIDGPGSPNIEGMTAVNGSLVFVADNSDTGREVWISDGTSTGTYVLIDAFSGPNSSNPKSLFAFNNDLIFSSSDLATGNEPRLAFLAPKISMEQPVSNRLPSNGLAAVDFTPTQSVVFGQNTTLTFTIRNEGVTQLRNITASISGLHAAEFSIITRPASTVNGSGTGTIAVRFTPREGGERVARLTVLSSDTSTPAFVINLSGDCTKETTVTTQPISQLLKVGAAFTLSAQASTTATTPITMQWRKNGRAIDGAVTDPLYLWPLKLTDSGAYSAQFRSNTTAAGTGTSDVAQLGIVEDFSPPRIQVIRQGSATSTTTISVNASGNGLTYQWMRSSTIPPTIPEMLVNTSTAAPTKFRNVTTRTLTITGATETDGMFYYCIVGAAGVPTVQGGTTQFRVASQPTLVNASQNMPNGMIGRFYQHQITLADTTEARAPISYSASGLPPGLVLNRVTGLISGRPTKVGAYDKIAISASNGLKLIPAVATTLQRVEILPMPTGLDGVYAGLIGREANLNERLGGRIDLSVVALTGAFSGRLSLGTVSYPFKGSLDIGPPGPPTLDPPYSAKVVILRKGILSPLTLTFTIDPITKDRFSGLIESKSAAGDVSASVTAYKQIHKASPSTENAAKYMGLYHFGLKLPAEVSALPNPNLTLPSVPQGNGYGSFNVAAAGTLRITGRMADGEAFTSSLFVGPLGEVPLFFAANSTKNKVSVLGLLKLNTRSTSSPNDNTLTSTDLTWVRPANTALVSSRAPATRTYRAGFGLPGTPVPTPIELEAFGGLYVPPVTLLKITTPPMPVPVPTVANAKVEFVDGGLTNNFPTGSGAAFNPDITVAVTSTNTNVVIASSPAKTSITPNRTTGLISGRFSLSDPNARTQPPLTPNPVLRTVTYQGLIIPDNEAETHEGVGYFMLPQLPTADNATLITTTPIQSGKMIFKKL